MDIDYKKFKLKYERLYKWMARPSVTYVGGVSPACKSVKSFSYSMKGYTNGYADDKWHVWGADGKSVKKVDISIYGVTIGR